MAHFAFHPIAARSHHVERHQALRCLMRRAASVHKIEPATDETCLLELAVELPRRPRARRHA
jgi:hypothetical protein